VANRRDEATAIDRATIFKTPATGDPALAELVHRLVAAYPGSTRSLIHCRLARKTPG